MSLRDEVSGGLLKHEVPAMMRLAERGGSMSDKALDLLLVEDNPGDIRLIGQALQESSSFQYNLTIAGRLEQALRLLEARPFDLVMLDLSLPDSWGLDTFVKTQAKAPNIPIVMLTGFDIEQFAIEALRLGAQDYLVKGRMDGDVLARSTRYAIERKQAQQELEKKTQALEEALLAKSQILSTATHELKTPLTNIVGYARRLLGGESTVGPLTERQRSYLDRVLKNSLHQEVLIDDLLTVSRIEAGKLELTIQAIDLREEIAEVLELLAGQLEDRHIRPVLDINGGSPRAKADRLRFTQIMSNLLSNACKYSPADGTVTVRVKELPQFVRIDVQDHGIGISKPDQAKLFTKFFRANNSSTREASFAGLGLFVTKHLVEAQGGQIWVESEEGAGSTFSFALPR